MERICKAQALLTFPLQNGKVPCRAARRPRGECCPGCVLFIWPYKRVSSPHRDRGEVTSTMLRQEPLEGTGRDPAFGHCIHARQWQRARQIHITRMILQANAAETITAVNGLMVRLGCFAYLPQNMGDGCVLRPAIYRCCSLGVCKEQASSSNFPFAVSKLPSTGKRC